MPTVYNKTLKCVGNTSRMSLPSETFHLVATCGMGVTQLHNLTKLGLYIGLLWF